VQEWFSQQKSKIPGKYISEFVTFFL